MEILLLTPQLPYPPHQGTSLRNFHIICGLAEQHEVHLLSFLEPDQTAVLDAITPLAERCATIVTVPLPPRSTAQRLRQLVTSQLPDMAHRLASQMFANELTTLLKKRPFDVVQIEGIELARWMPLIREHAPTAKIVFDNHNAETELQRRNFLTDRRIPRRWPAALYSWIQVQRLTQFERGACLAADGVTAVSETDAGLLRRLIEPIDRPVWVIPNAIDVKAYQTPPARLVSFDLMFSGKMDYRPNVDAVLWFAAEVWPLILQERPLTTWAIVGQKPHPRLERLRALPNVTLTGWVESMAPYLHGAQLLIMPFRIGSGTRLKLIEGMAAGKPIVSTPTGAEGFPVQDGREILLAETPMAMKTAVLQLLDDDDLRARLGENGRTFAQQYDWRVVMPRFNQLYQEITGA